MTISPSLTLGIIDRIEKTLWSKYVNYETIRRYLLRWHIVYDGFGNSNFTSIPENVGYIEKTVITQTLDSMDNELLFQIAVDLGIEIPGLIYSIAEIKGILSERYEDAGRIFEKAIEKVYKEPSVSVVMANSALERLIKKICLDNDFISNCNKKDTLSDLTKHILKQFKFSFDKNLNKDLRNVGSGLLTVTQAIENLRSEHTEAHGTEDEIISDPIHAMLVVNAVATVGLFLLNYHEKNYKSKLIEETVEDVPF